MYIRFLALWLAALTSAAVADPTFQKERERFAEFCSWTPAEKALLLDLADDKLDRHTLLRACLLVGGNTPQQAHRFEANFVDSCRQYRRLHPNPAPDQATRIRQLFAYLMKRHLYGEYTPELSDVGATISHGEFNCLTATILFRRLCEEFGVSVTAIWEPAHVRCWIPVAPGGSGYLVETTAESVQTAVSGLYPLRKLSDRALSEEQLLGKVFYNRGVRCLQQDRFASALTSTWAGCLLDPHDVSAQNNLRACLNNWALWESQQDDFELAIRLLDAGLQLDPDYGPFSRNLQLLKNH